MRKVLITQRLVSNADYPEERDALDVRWAPLLREVGLVPVPVPSAVNVDEFLAAVGDVAGLILSGGNDLAVVNDNALSRRRDALEEALVSRLGGVPILGVCRGLQFLGGRSGFSLVKVTGHTATRHVLKIDPSSRWLREFDGLEVNSYHSFSLSLQSGERAGVRGVGFAPDGTIEALEHATDRTLGIMWHPERESPFRPQDLHLLKEFFK